MISTGPGRESGEMTFQLRRRRLAERAQRAGVWRASAMLFAMALAPGLEPDGATAAQPPDPNAQGVAAASSTEPDGAPAPIAGLWRYTMTQKDVPYALPKVVLSMCVGELADVPPTSPNAPKGDQGTYRKLCTSSARRDAEGHLVT